MPLIADATLVSPIDPGVSAVAGSSPGEPPPLLLSDGQRVPTSIASFERRNSSPSASPWLPDPGLWQRVPGPAEGATTMLVAPVPQSGLGQSVWMSGRRLPAFWLLPVLSSKAEPADIARPHPTLTQEHALAMLMGELTNPALRWRAELALERVGITPPPPAWIDPVLGAWAAQSQARWNAALQRVRMGDPALADQMVGALTRWLVTPDTALPLWPTREEEILGLILSIIRPGASDEAIRRTVLAFLERQPQWLTWVADDAGGIVGGSIAAVNLSPTPALLSVRAPGGPWEAHGMLAQGTIALVPAPASPGAAAPSLWEVRLGGRTRALPVTTSALSLSPPGLPIGPFWHDWTLAGLIEGTGQSVNPGRDGWIGGLIHREPRMDAPVSDSSGWVIYIEVRRPPCELPRAGEQAPATDAVRLCFGPTGTPRAEVTVRCTGLTTFDSGAPGQGAMLTTAADRWAFTLPIDRAWLEPDGTFLFGAQFLPHDGARATWPRPLLPHQRALGRVRIEPGAWTLQSGLQHPREAIIAR